MGKVTYIVTEGSIRVGRMLKKRGFRFTDDSPEAKQIGVKDLGRLVKQGWLKIDGLRAGLERGTIAPDYQRLPTEITYDDPQGTRIAEVKHGGKRTTQSKAGPIEIPDTGDGTTEILLPEAEDAPSVPRKTQPGTLRGKWQFDPAMIADKPLAVLNAMIQDVDPSTPVFGDGEEDDARAFMSADFAAAAAAESERAEEPEEPSRAVKMRR